MSTLCQHCHLAVPEGSTYCRECSAPQFHIRRPEPGDEARAPDTTPRHAGQIVWPIALRYAAAFALPAGLLLTLREGRGVPEILWVGGASYLALRLYRKRARLAPRLTAQLGGRIGLLVGTIAAAVNLCCEAIRLCVERYLLHHGAAIDAQMHSFAQLEVDLIRSSDPDTAAKLDWLTRFWLSPEGAATLLMLSLFASTLFTLFFGWLAGWATARYGRRLPS